MRLAMRVSALDAENAEEEKRDYSLNRLDLFREIYWIIILIACGANLHGTAQPRNQITNKC
jgi:hypothetical protein